MTTNDSIIQNGLRSSNLYLIGSIQGTISSISEYFGLLDENIALKLKNTRLSYENYTLQDALLENIRLKKLLQFKYELDADIIPAKVIGFSPTDIVTGILLSTEDYKKIAINSAVITTEGLVGKIVRMSGKYAVCQILFDANSRVSVRIQRNRELGILASDGNNSIFLNNISNTIKVVQGDVLYTSGFSRIYPPNIKVGVITSAKINEERLFQKITVSPSVNFNSLEEVFIIQVRKSDE
jgi:rod shape-determining protein MreC